MSRCWLNRWRRVPMVMQMEAVESGAAALVMIFAAYGRWITLEMMRTECGISRDGCKAAYLLNAARRFGMKAEICPINTYRLYSIQKPVILCLKHDKFSVLTNVRGDMAYINDPNRGKIKIGLSELKHDYDGNILTFEPTSNFHTGGHPASIFRFIHEHLQGAIQPLLLTFITGFLLALVSIALPLLSQMFADNILVGKNPDWVKPFFFAFAAIIIFQFVVQLIIYLYIRTLKIKLAVVSCSEFMWHTLRLPISFYAQRSVGDLILRGQAAGSVPRVLVQYLAPLVSNILLVFIYLFVMIRYNITLTIVAIATALLNVLMIRMITAHQTNLNRVVQRDNGKWQSTTMSCLSSIETIKAAGAEDSFLQRWAADFSSFVTSSSNQSSFLTYTSIIPLILTNISNCIVLCLGAYYILKGSMTVGMLLAFQGYMMAYLLPIKNITESYQNILNMRTDMERIDDIYHAKTDVPPDINDTIDEGDGKLSGLVELRHVTFGYNSMAPALIKDFNMTLQPGKSVAFVGNSGCRKSTLAKLISGLYQPWEGDVLFDGKHKSEINRLVFVSSVAVIDQDIVLFNGTIADNIKMWDDSIEDFAMILASNDAQIHEEIAARTGGYSSMLSDNGRNLSGGQRQRIEIAAALAKEPSILIMDEATSALDTKTEGLLMKAVKNLGITLIIIAHRLSTIRDCDEIIIMEQGKVKERGNHEQLMQNKDGNYYKLMQSM